MFVGSQIFAIRGRARPGARAGALAAHQWLESRVIRRADAVALNTPELHREFTDWYGPDISTRFHVVTNGYDADILAPYASAAPTTSLPLVITHAGSLYGARDPRPLLEGLAKCLREGAVPANGIHLNLVGKIASAFNVDTAITAARPERLRYSTVASAPSRVAATPRRLARPCRDSARHAAAGPGKTVRVCRTSTARSWHWPRTVRSHGWSVMAASAWSFRQLTSLESPPR